MVEIIIKYQDLHCWADCADGFIQVVKQTNWMHPVYVRAMIGPKHLVPEIAASDRLGIVWLVHYDMDIDTNRTEYWLEYLNQGI